MLSSLDIRWTVLSLASLLAVATAGSNAWCDDIDFQKQILPILTDRCAQCHGTDEATREGGLRLDLRDAALEGGDSGDAAIVPGDANSSELFRRLVTEDESERMPPEEFGARLTDEEIDLVRRWIDEGAPYAKHWAFEPPVKSTQVKADGVHPIDQLVEAKARDQGLVINGPATAERLCRRIYLDLIGLPPSPEEVARFEVEGVEATVDRLLASDRYGEKWARQWMDVARYSDTNGYEKDLKREQWIWRDWVIDAINADMPYDEFLLKQIAGDLLPQATQADVIATGFLRNSMLNEEGAIIPEQFRMVEMFDRMDCIGKAALGITLQCAQCHTHKFDPLTIDEYYGLFAFLNDTHEAKSWVYTEEQQAAIRSLKAEQDQVIETAKREFPDWSNSLANWLDAQQANQPDWTPVHFLDMNSVSGLNHPVHIERDAILMLGHTSSDVYWIGEPRLDGVTGLRLEALTHGDLPFLGPGRNSVGAWAIGEIEVSVRPPGTEDWTKLTLVNPTCDYAETSPKVEEGKPANGPVEFLIDGNEQTRWRANRGEGRRNQASVAVLQFEEPLKYPESTELKVVLKMGDMLGCARVSLCTSEDPKAPAIPHDVMLAAEKPLDERSDQEQRATFVAWLRSLGEGSTSMVQQFDATWAKYPKARTSVLHLSDREPQNQRVTYRLDRGEWDQPEEIIAPGTPAFLHTLEVVDDGRSEPPRLQFARWLVDERSPLTARVQVNRIWQAMFGRGLVETAEDFGTRTAIPEQLDVLDWLAVELMEQDWSQKAIVKSIVMSQAYQRDSATTSQQLAADPTNRWLTRGPRFRADAEVIRDIALCVSGLIHHEMGGPSIIPPVPKNVLDYNYVYPSYWKPAEPPQRYRRAVYGFRKRSMPDPSMSSLDSPNGDFSCARRVRSNTPLGALTGLNEPIFVEASRALALRVLRESPQSEEARIVHAYRLCVSRDPTAIEIGTCTEMLRQQRERIAQGWLNPREISTGKADQLPELPEGTTPQDAAAWTLLARVLLNLDETLTKN